MITTNAQLMFAILTLDASTSQKLATTTTLAPRMSVMQKLDAPILQSTVMMEFLAPSIVVMVANVNTNLTILCALQLTNVHFPSVLKMVADSEKMLPAEEVLQIAINAQLPLLVKLRNVTFKTMVLLNAPSPIRTAMMERNAPPTLAMQTPVHAFTNKLRIPKNALQIPQFAKKILTVLLGLLSKISIANALLLYAILLLEFAKLFHLPAKLVSLANNVANLANQEMHVTYQPLLALRTIPVTSFAIALIFLAMILLLAPKTAVTLTLEHVFMNL